MIGVVAPPSDLPALREFFELFKTPWQIHRDGLAAEVLLCVNAEVPTNAAGLVLIFAADEQPFDRVHDLRIRSAGGETVLLQGSQRLPIFAGSGTFPDSDDRILRDEKNGEPAAIEFALGDQPVVRIGYDLAAEIRHLLNRGQPREYSRIPTFDRHIAFLREIILSHSIPLVEVPALPDGFSFTACLTHDVDDPRIRSHGLDQTMVGFIGRALFESLFEWVRGRRTWRQVAVSYRAVFSLPLVYLRRTRDFWNTFATYTEIEGEARSTFFVIPEKDNPGRHPRGRRTAKRAVKYSLSEIADDLRQLVASGHEVAVHGIDAWHDAAHGKAEAARVREVTGEEEIGVRMHWLFQDENTPARLEKAGYSYDSTIGYNNAVGYRAGTTQVFKPLTVEHLLELPMHVMDTAMFYHSYMALSPTQARSALDELIETTSRFGGVLTVNWHDRSIAPERFWDEPYIDLVQKLKNCGAWMPTAAEAVRWFRARRSVQIEENADEGGAVRVSIASHDARLPGFRLRVHQAKNQAQDFAFNRSAQFVTRRAATAVAHV